MPRALEELLLSNPNAPTNDEYAREFARKLYPPAMSPLRLS